MHVLALDTSSAAVTAALCEVGDGVDVLAQHQVVNARGHGENLAPLIARCVDESTAVAGDRRRDRARARTPDCGSGWSPPRCCPRRWAYPRTACARWTASGRRTTASLVAADARRKEVYWATYRAGVRDHGPDVARPADVDTTALTAMAGAGARLYADVLGLPLLDVDHPDPALLVACAPATGSSRARRPTRSRRSTCAARTRSCRPPRNRSRSERGAVVPMTPAHIDALMPYEREMFGAEAWTVRRVPHRTRRHAQTGTTSPPKDADGALLGWAGVMRRRRRGRDPDRRRRARRAAGAASAGSCCTRCSPRRSAEARAEVFLEVRVRQRGGAILYEHEGFVESGAVAAITTTAGRTRW